MSHIRRDVPSPSSATSQRRIETANRSPAPANGTPRHARGVHADRTLLWAGDPKLVIVSYPIPHANYLFELLGYAENVSRRTAEPKRLPQPRYPGRRSPVTPADCPCRSGQDAQLVPYAVTPEFCALAEALRREHGLRVLLPEHPQPRTIWLRDFIDTKAGFHHLAGRWRPNAGDLLPEAHFCHDLAQAAHRALVYPRRQGVHRQTGHRRKRHRQRRRRAGTSPRNRRRSPCSNSNRTGERDLIVVEEYCASDLPVSPSVEVFVPPLHNGEPAVTYVCEQLFRGLGEFSGVIVSAELRERPGTGRASIAP